MKYRMWVFGGGQKHEQRIRYSRTFDGVWRRGEPAGERNRE